MLCSYERELGFFEDCCISENIVLRCLGILLSSLMNNEIWLCRSAFSGKQSISPTTLDLLKLVQRTSLCILLAIERCIKVNVSVNAGSEILVQMCLRIAEKWIYL